MISGFLRFVRFLCILSTSSFIWRWLYKKLFGSSAGFKESITRLLYRLGPSFIKMGQILSTRPDLVGDGMVQCLSKLQDKLPGFCFKKVKKTIKQELGVELEEAFSEFDPKPAAAASIAQVHKATTISGKVVAVKILRPNIKKKFISDLKLLNFIARAISFCSKKTQRLKLKETIELLKKTVDIELNLRFEAAAGDQLKENLKDNKNIYVPQIYWGVSAKRVLVMEWVEGISIYKKELLLKQKHNLEKLSQNIAITFFDQVYKDGFFHADIHPGNILVDKKGRIVLIDFGIMGYISPIERIFVAKILHGFINRDYDAVAQTHIDAGYVPKDTCLQQFSLACRSIGEPVIGKEVGELSIGLLLRKLFEITEEFQMQTQTQLLLLQKTMVTIEGVGYSLYPEVNMWKLAEPWINKWYKEQFGIKTVLQEKLNKITKSFIKDAASIIKEVVDKDNSR